MKPRARSRPLVFRPLLVTRIANAVPGLAVAALAVPVAEAVPRYATVGGTACMLAGAALAIRGYLMGVSVDRDRVVVRGFVSSRAIRRADIVGLTPLPAVRWREWHGRCGARRPGRTRFTPIIAFMTIGHVLATVEKHNADVVDRLSRILR